MVCGYLENCIMQTIVVHVTITHQLPTLPCWKCGLAMFSSYFILITASCLYGAETASLTVLSGARSFFSGSFLQFVFSPDVCVLT